MKIIKYKLADNSEGLLKSDKSYSIFKSDDYNFAFNKLNGFFMRYGKTINDDPVSGLPEIADIEISTICSEGCAFCYKNNTKTGKYMNITTFKKIFNKLPKTIGQIAFGIGDINSNPDMWKIFNHCKNNSVIPNLTINGKNITNDIVYKLVNTCGAVAVSFYDKKSTYNTVHKLTSNGLKQTNIHFLLSNETIDDAYKLFDDYKKDTRLSKLNSIVFLSLKKKGRACQNYSPVSIKDFEALVKYAIDNGIPIGFDSCSANKIIEFFKDEKYKSYMDLIEPCESTLFSCYINVEGYFFPCSFIENTKGWENGINVLSFNDFINDIWFNESTIKFRENLLKCNRGCPVYKI